MKGIVLTGGFGTRLRPITYTNQKQLIPIANKPCVYYAIEDLVHAGIKEIGVIFGPNEQQVKETIGDGSRWDVEITYIHQDLPRGLAHAASITKEFVGDDPFIMYLGDNILKGGIKDFVDNFASSDASASIMLTEVDDPQQFGIAELDTNGVVKRLIEKPKSPPSNLALVGIYGFRNAIFDAVRSIKPSWRDEFEITDAIQWLLEHNHEVTYSTVQGWWKDTGKPEDILEANQLILDTIKSSNNGTIEDGATLTGRVKIGKGTIIKNGATIRGPSIIGDNCTIGPSVYIGPYTSVGNGVTIENSDIDFSIIFDDATISGINGIRDSMIGTGCKISTNRENGSKSNKFTIGDHSEVFLI